VRKYFVVVADYGIRHDIETVIQAPTLEALREITQASAAEGTPIGDPKCAGQDAWDNLGALKRLLIDDLTSERLPTRRVW
jgi:hypothetical protein